MIVTLVVCTDHDSDVVHDILLMLVFVRFRVWFFFGFRFRVYNQ